MLHSPRLGRHLGPLVFWALLQGLMAPLGLAQEAAPEDTSPEAAPPQEVIGCANGGMEAGEPGALPQGWRFNSNAGGTAVLQTEGALEGDQALLIEVPAVAEGQRSFTNLMQSFDATPWRGQRVRFRGAVRVGELAEGTGVQLWFRVDRPDKKRGAFDNMDDRPIVSTEWTHHDIVLDVAKDADRIACGLFVIGQGAAWIDDVSLEIVDSALPLTRIDPAYAPPQPFFTPWLALPCLALLLFGIAFWPRSNRSQDSGEGSPSPQRGAVRRFATLFAVTYWLLYCLPGPFAQLMGSLSSLLADCGVDVEWLRARTKFVVDGYAAYDRDGVTYTAGALFGIERELIEPNGSGDTTFSHIALLNRYVLAFAIAILGSLLARKGRGFDTVLDLLRSYLRYVLAFAMLGYGLAKLHINGNQFPEIGGGRLDQTWGDSSPMGVVWKFMGSSRPYTMFAGLGEVVAGVLLVWRRTSILGAFVAIGVMTNVVMINFCYDVPVKLYSSHLLAMGLLIALPDVSRMFRLLVLNRTVEPAQNFSLWAKAGLRWVRWPLKAVVLTLGVGVPLWGYVSQLQRDLNSPPPVEMPSDEQPLLVRRGFRWINEAPFNR